jgi:hypothetical protein
MYISTLSLNSTVDGVGGQRNAPAYLPLEKTRHPLYRRLDMPHDLSGRVWKMLPQPGFDPRNLQPLTSHYTDCTIPAPDSPSVPNTPLSVPCLQTTL